ncbi:toll/interleukin-1 receptor domain-containing protein [Streptomyces sp. NPDC002817]|uniref:toll/interleukin-1 receptor domain-containing protein n=1 Tax=Streptomyces sp. NPDC088357 TaxID=3154655 RepID=UPI003446F49A
MSAIDGSGRASDGTSDRRWFTSHAGADRAWAEWVGWQLLDAGHQVELDDWDSGAGDNFVMKMNAARERVIATVLAQVGNRDAHIPRDRSRYGG